MTLFPPCSLVLVFSRLFSYRTIMSSSSNKNVFNPAKVLIVAKTTRYDMEKRLAGSMSDGAMENMVNALNRRGTNVNRLIRKHHEHKDFLQHLKQLLEKRNVDTRVVERFEYTEECANWADAVFAAGGDGTFLLAASKVTTRNKAVIGFNTDPEGSEGHMCLLRKAPMNEVESALNHLFEGDFEWLYRTRIRISMNCEGGVGESIPLHDSAMNREPSTTRWDQRESRRRKRWTSPRGERRTEELPVLSLNEVFVGESLSSRVSYFELSLDHSPFIKQKNSGLTVCTGSGSTSWYFNINKLTPHSVSQVLSLAAKYGLEKASPSSDVIERICQDFNEQLMFAPDLNKMAFCIRDPIFNSTFPPSESRGFAHVIKVRSRGYDSHLVVDGGISFQFNDGAEAELRVNDEDSLRTVIFR